MMKAVFVSSRSRVRLRDVPNPRLETGDILVKMRACGLCGSDLEKIYGRYPMLSARLGHEPAGEIIDTAGRYSNLHRGDRVFVHHHVSCYSCYYCLHGDYTMCTMYQKSNIEPCGLAEQFIVPEWNVRRGGVIELPHDVSFEDASLIEPLACCIRALNRCRFEKGEDIAIFGAGPTGLMHALLAEAFGAGKIVVLDFNGFRLEFAKKCGVRNVINYKSIKQFREKVKDLTHGMGVDTAIVATANTMAVADAIAVTRRGGKIVLFGVPQKGSTISIDFSHLYSNELTIVPSYASSEIETNLAMKLIAEKRVNIGRLITHRYSIGEVDEAIKSAHLAKDAMKVVITN
jgi:L-iditol 2-dehydrogenase